MSLLSPVAIRWLPFTLVTLFGADVVLGINASSNATKVCCPPFDKRVELNGTVFCFATVSIPNDRATIGNYLCRNLHPHANLASFHSVAEISVVANHEVPVITGLVYEFDKLSWRDGTPVDYTPWYSYQSCLNSSEFVVEVSNTGYFRSVTLQGSTSRKAMCKMEAEHTECSDCETCILRRAGQNFFCYQFTWFNNGQTVGDVYDMNWCDRLYPGYDLASIHSKEENDFIVDHHLDQENNAYTNPKYIAIGLRVPPSKRGLPLAKDLFEWTDGTPFDYDNWENSTSYAVHGFPANANELTNAGSSLYQWHYSTHRYEWLERDTAVINSDSRTWINGNGNAPKWAVCKKSVKCPYHTRDHGFSTFA